jgi:hypothetical protein
MTSLRNIEEDEAGRLRAFREKFGRGWDVEATDEEAGEVEGEANAASAEESLMDLISGYQEGTSDAERSEVSKSSTAGQGKGKGKN